MLLQSLEKWKGFTLGVVALLSKLITVLISAASGMKEQGHCW